MRVLAGNYPQPNGRVTPAPDRLTLVNGVPVTIALQYTSGKPCTSRINGEQQMMYTLADGRRAWFSLAVAREIDALRLAPGQPFTVCKYGPQEWDIQYAHSSEPAAAQQTEARAPRPQPPAPPAPAAPQSHVNGAGEDCAALLARCYTQAIDLQLAAFREAAGKGLHFAPTAEALQACAATLLINQYGGRR